MPHYQIFPWRGVTRGVRFVLGERWGADFFDQLEAAFAQQADHELETVIRAAICDARPELAGCIVYSAELREGRPLVGSPRSPTELHATILHASLPEWRAGETVTVETLDPPPTLRQLAEAFQGGPLLPSQVEQLQHLPAFDGSACNIACTPPIIDGIELLDDGTLRYHLRPQQPDDVSGEDRHPAPSGWRDRPPLL